tara:strand:+ start:293 stop:670 length:378 start_codon:yes stop_codon:yes gene_type:complete
MKKLEVAYKSISEVAEILDLKNKKSGKLNTHTIRYWEKEFKQIRPKFFNSNRRYYDPQSINYLKKIKYLLKEEGLKISGVKKILNKEQGFNLDDTSEKSISTSDKFLKQKIFKISKILKDLKDIK